MAKADAMVAQAMVTGKVSAETTVTTAEIVATAAADVAAIRLAHRGDITRMRSLVIRLLAECEAEAADPAVFESLGELLRNPDERGQDKLNEAYHKAISLPQRIKGVKELAEALRVLIALEREAYGIGVEEKPKTPLEDLSDEEIEARLRARLPA
jgi:hypothetical protein